MAHSLIVTVNLTGSNDVGLQPILGVARQPDLHPYRSLGSLGDDESVTFPVDMGAGWDLSLPNDASDTTSGARPPHDHDHHHSLLVSCYLLLVVLLKGPLGSGCEA